MNFFKKKPKTKVNQFEHDPEIENMIQKKDAELKEKASNSAKHFAKRNMPAATGDCLEHYTGELTAGYEKLEADVIHHLQTSSNVPEAQIDADHAKEKDGMLVQEIKEREHQNQNNEYELENFDPTLLFRRLLLAFIATLFITIGDTMFNTKSFQVLGDSLVSAFIFSICISACVLIFAHIWPSLYKRATNTFQRRLVIILTLVIVTVVFTGIAIWRSSYLAEHAVYIQPFYFVIINLFFFIVSALASFFIMPSWEEIKNNASKIKLYQAIRKRRKEIEQFKKERQDLRETIAERTKLRVRLLHYTNNYISRIRKMSKETVELFKRTNLAHRTDRKTPDCFFQQRPDSDENNYSTVPILTLKP